MRLLGLIAGLAAVVAPCLAEEAMVRRARYVMGTVFEITARGDDRDATALAVEAAFSEITRADKVISHYKTDSELTRLNRAPAGAPVAVDPGLGEILRLSAVLSSESGGAFRVTVSPLVQLWSAAVSIPMESDITRAISESRPDCYIVLDSGEVRKRTPHCRIEFGAIGKGWAVDQALNSLHRAGIRHAFVSAGTSTVAAFGTDGVAEGWTVSVRDPDDESGTIHDFLLVDSAMSTSANYEQARVIGGRRYGHIIDPVTGWPAEAVKSVTVIAPTGAEADALSTAVFVLGAENGAELLSRRRLEGLIVGNGDTLKHIRPREIARWK